MKSYQAPTRFCGSINGDSVGGRLQAIRSRLCMTRKQFAEHVGLTDGQVARLERGGKGTRNDQPSIDQIARICGVQPVWLYAGSVAPRNLWPEWWGGRNAVLDRPLTPPLNRR